MQTMWSSFEEFRKTIEPDERVQKIAQAADDPVREHLEGHWSFAERHVTTFLYGSYKRHTAEGNIKDVDLVVVTNFTMKTNPIEVLEELRDSLGELYEEPDLADQRRSIRVDRPLPEIPGCKLTLDVIPAIYQGKPEEPLWVPDREKKQWVLSHPRSHLQYTSVLNARSYQERMFVPLVKMMKHWWKYQFERWHTGTQAHKRKPKGFWVEVMTGEYTDLSKRSYPELVVSLLENAFGELKTFRTDGKVPELKDPGLKHQTIKTSIVSVIAHHAARLAVDTVLGHDPSLFPYSMYLIGLTKWWVFEAPFHTIPIDTGGFGSPGTKTEASLEAQVSSLQFIGELLEKRSDAASSSS